MSHPPFDCPLCIKLTGPMMHYHRNSLTHRSVNLLCDDLSERNQSLNRSSLAYPTTAHSLTYSSFGERASSFTAPTSMAAMLAPDRNQMIHPVDAIVSGYYANMLSVRTPHLPQLSSYYPIADSGYAADAYSPLVPTPQPFDTTVDFGTMFSEPFAAHQPPEPPAAPEQSILPIPPFHYYSCRWLSGPPCDGAAPGKNREMGEHLRVLHRFIGHERDMVQCEWENCGQSMQRMNVPRHIVSRHLLAAASCRFCGKRFSRPDVVARHERTCGGVSPVSTASLPGI